MGGGTPLLHQVLLLGVPVLTDRNVRPPTATRQVRLIYAKQAPLQALQPAQWELAAARTVNARLITVTRRSHLLGAKTRVVLVLRVLASICAARH